MQPKLGSKLLIFKREPKKEVGDAPFCVTLDWQAIFGWVYCAPTTIILERFFLSRASQMSIAYLSYSNKVKKLAAFVF